MNFRENSKGEPTRKVVRMGSTLTGKPQEEKRDPVYPVALGRVLFLSA